MPGAVDRLVETTVTVERAPEIVAVVTKLRVIVSMLPDNVTMTVTPGRLDVIVRVKLSISLFNVDVSDHPE